MSPIKLIVLDIAGTIIEDHGEVIRAFTKALTDNRVPFAKDELKMWVGASKREVIRHFITQADHRGQVEQRVETSYLSFRAELERCYAEQLVPIGGALETFRWCRDRGMLLATTTGFYREISDLVLNQAGWRDFFAANVSSSDVREGRPAPYMIFRAMEATGVKSVKEVVAVGDTPLDLQSGSNAGVTGVIGVLTGAHGRESLEREPHTHIIHSIAELPELIAREF